jgi:hypothetical protein
MFERLIARVERLARARARARSLELADALQKGLQAEAEAGGVRLSGRGLRRRIALDPRLGQLIAGVLK